jgi:PKD repeat protein
MTGIAAGKPTAQFAASTVKGQAPLTVQFTDQSTISGTATYRWDINYDGTTDYTTKNPVHTYTKTGTYSVKLIVKDSTGRDNELKTSYITVTAAPVVPVAPVAAFRSDKQSGNAPLTVQFTDQSTGTTPLTYAWNFGDGGTSNSRSPSHVYTTVGTFNVVLTVTNIAGTKSVTKSGYITVTAAPLPPQAAFSSDVQSGYAPLIVHFSDQSVSSGTTTYKWDVTNDGTTDYTSQNPVHTYKNAGTFTVKLTVTNTAGSDIERKTGYITVTNAPPVPVAPVAAFTSSARSGYAPLSVTFTDTSAGTSPLTYAWNFGDGGTSVIRNPSHTFDAEGTYTIKLSVTNALGSDDEVKTGYITVSPPGTSHAGVALTFDDNSVDAWYAARPIFQKYNAHVTFFISNFNQLDQSEITKLKTLQADGHEIAFHGYNHEDEVEYLQSHTLNDYLNNEIIRGINLMRSQGFNPVNFAYPYGADNPAARPALGAYFSHMRDTYYDWDNTIYYTYGSNTPYIAGIGIDDNTYGNSLTDITTGIAKAKADDKILIFYGHETVASSNPGEYQTSFGRLESILKYVSDNGMKTYTIAEIH